MSILGWPWEFFCEEFGVNLKIISQYKAKNQFKINSLCIKIKNWNIPKESEGKFYNLNSWNSSVISTSWTYLLFTLSCWVSKFLPTLKVVELSLKKRKLKVYEWK